MTITALIDFSDPLDRTAPRLRHAFGTPRALLLAHAPREVRAVLDAVQAAAAQGAWCVGALRYEAAPAFDPAFQTHAADGPLAWFAVYDAALPWPEAALTEDAPELRWQPGPERAHFDAALGAIHQAIARGEYYQVNYTAPLLAALHGGGAAPARALFGALQRAQPGGYAAYLDMGDEQVLSVSPELFFDWRSGAGDGNILTRPMKGTAPRGATPEQDAANAAALRASPKERAENVMIVDLLRNDLSRIAQPFSVQVPRLFHTEALPAVWQMTSDVQARTRPGTQLADVFGALFPCGSITGAPKVRAMQAIHALEAGPRGIYCGAVGVVRPDGQVGQGGIRATFNVPIRTVVLKDGQARCGIGSGITSSAEPDAEWNEWRHKRAFVERASQPFDLLETLALDGGQLRNLADHLARLQDAAAHFGYAWAAVRVEQCLQALAQAHPQGLWRVRLLLGAAGTPRAEAFAMQATLEPVRLQLADRPLDEAHSEFVRYKTTRRAHYAAFEPLQSGVFDTLLWNAEGEITECTRGNVAMRIGGRWVTPPLSCGLLPGVGRAVALREGRLSEAVVRVEVAARVQEWAFLNSLRGWMGAELLV
ncbi:bifunctional aminodeoxychorismate synthase component I/aminotransferase [Acidovorax sp. SRB_14]|uniref:chorismate-binding protein n=1 Tax=Acidovorax sp. SRB_14 TaxID=1962699 RepID=UPI001565CCE5|nr:chorismate-binding protein [Acidovorax sp. SRB_14]NMM80669.1 bifunctional aminodeoxychorismate synthase component I/aminotransferase [Acidovorax sp. SRB_14]